ncbi:MAG: 30S ribosomal protein S6 [Tissierellia bacterium]|nr:30S ribosomal protein S6 [Tissierellia bacterium]
MRNYEMIVVFKPNLEEELRKNVLDRLFETINSNGKVGEVEDWGQKKLAYEINYIKEGHYYLVNFESDPSIIKEVQRRAQIADQIIRYLVVSKES